MVRWSDLDPNRRPDPTGCQYVAHWEPVTGCTGYGPACKKCIAAAEVPRLKNLGNPRYRNLFQLTLHHGELKRLTSFKKKLEGKTAVFYVCQGGDLFHKNVPGEYIEKIFSFINEMGPDYRFNVYTKRSKRLMEFSNKYPYKINRFTNMFVTVENPSQYYKVHNLRMTKTRGPKYLSLCPLTGPMPDLPLEGIAGVTCLNQIGDDPVPFDHAWVWDLARQCREARVKLFNQVYPDRLVVPFNGLKKGFVAFYRRAMVFQLIERTSTIAVIPTPDNPLYPDFKALWGEMRQLSDEELRAAVRQAAPEFFEA